MNDTQPTVRARFATLDAIRKDVLPVFLEPVPCAETVRNWFDRAKIPRIKASPMAKRGGGPCYYSVSAVEKLLRTSALGARIATEVML